MRLPLILSSVLFLGCGGTSAVADAGSGRSASFIALVGDFEGYPGWTHFDLGHQTGGAVHLPGARSVFINRPPPPGSATFPVGTILVKVVHPEADAGEGDQVFAMAKRGGDFNDGGAAGWEWFELDAVAQPPLMVWRGALPPARKGYGGGAGGACNECHAITHNDFVLAPELLLGNF